MVIYFRSNSKLITTVSLLFDIVVMLMISGMSPIALAANMPSGIVVDSTRNVFSSDGTNSRTLSFTAAENGFSPAGIAIDPSGHVFVGDGTNNRILKISNIGEFIREWGTAGSENDQYNAPIGAAVVSQGHVFNAVGGNQRIQKFSNTGDFIRTWNRTSSRLSLSLFTLVLQQPESLLFITSFFDFYRRIAFQVNFFLKYFQ